MEYFVLFASMAIGVLVWRNFRSKGHSKKFEVELSIIKEKMLSTGYFKPDKIPELLEKIKAALGASEILNLKSIYDGDRFLTAAEKKVLKLNTRIKYSSTFLDYFDLTSLGSVEPKYALEAIVRDALGRVSRKNQLEEIKKISNDAGVGIRCQIVRTEDDRSCRVSKRHSNIWYKPSELPLLPLPDCDADYCRCAIVFKTEYKTE